MSIAQIQKKRILEEITKAYFSAGEKPRLVDILNDASTYFSQFPVGNPLPFDLGNIRGKLKSDVDKFNEILARYALNIDVLYEACVQNSDDIMTLTTLLRTELERLKARRERLVAQIDDKLFTLYNTDGYYYSVSDTFSTLDLTDLNLTSAFVDTQSGTVQLPTLSSLTKRIPPNKVSNVAISVFVGGKETSYKTLGTFVSALDGLTNTLWGIEVSTDTPDEVVAVVKIMLGSSTEPVTLSRIDFDPYGMVPVQLFTEVEAVGNSTTSSATRIDFGESIKTSAYNMSFLDTAQEVSAVVLTLRKTQPDYTIDVSGSTKYRYIFGAKNIVLTEQIYDTSSRYVSQPLFLDEELVKDNVIDAVSLVVDADVPENSDVKYYVAADTGDVTFEFDDFDWKQIVPLSNIADNPNAVVRFEGARAFIRSIKANPGSSDLQLIALNSTDRDLKKRNPTPSVIPGVDIYRITDFDEEDVLPRSIVLEEGVNSTRIMYTTKNSSGLSLDYWKPYFQKTSTASTVYGQIDIGNEFFYGGDIGESNKSVFIETYLESSVDQPLLLKQFSKVDPNSRVWDVKVFLNGREVGDLPVGVDNLVIPWKFQQGLNHVIVLAQIPAATTAYPNPYVGTLDLMGDDDLNDFGTVKLATWEYVDMFKMQYNEVGQPYTFTIWDGEIVSRRKPTTNFRIKYAKSTSQAPTGVRVRMDISRESNNPHISPVIKSYRLRFLYGDL